MRRVQPLQLHEVEPSTYCKVSYSTDGLESEANVQTLVTAGFIFIRGGCLWVLSTICCAARSLPGAALAALRPTPACHFCRGNPPPDDERKLALEPRPSARARRDTTSAAWRWQNLVCADAA